MTHAQAKEYNEQLCKIEKIMMEAMETLEWFGALTPEFEDAYNMIQNLPEYEANE